MLIAGAVLFGCGPTARPTADPGERERNVKAGEVVEFDGGASIGKIDKYEWDFGDGSKAFGKTVSHAYMFDGNYTTTLTVYSGGFQHSAVVAVNVGAGCLAIAGLTVLTANPQPNAAVRFASTGSKGCDGSALVNYLWDFGDGATDMGDASKATVEHTYATSGSYTVALSVTDAKGHVGKSTRQLGVGLAGGKPVAICPAMVNAVQHKPVTLSATGMDPGGMALTFQWTFGDGTPDGVGSTLQHTYTTEGAKMARVVAMAPDNRSSDPCMTQVNVAPPPSYSGSWLLNPTAGSLSGCPDFSVPFPAATLTLVHAQSTDGGSPELSATPMGGSWPAGQTLVGSEDPPPAASGTFRLRKTLPNETRGVCGVVTREESVEAHFSSALAVMGTWKIIFTATSCLGSGTGCVPATCNCVAQVAYSGVKQ